MSRKTLRTVLAVVVLIGTVAAFAYYIHRHPETVQQLHKISPLTLVSLLLLYIVFQATLGIVQYVTLSLCGIKLGRKESLLLVSYSSIINFFGPLQSGPIFRAAYLKKRHGVSLKKYGVATVLYYGFYAQFSALFILTYFVGIWALVVVIAALVLAPVLRRYTELIPERFRSLQLEHVGRMAAAALAQVSVLAVIFYIELNSFGRGVAALPSLIYTGAANFALFVSLTPGAIGFREAFIVFSQRLHGIANDQIVTASLIDRGVYIVFLGLLAVLIFGLHADKFLKSKIK